MLREKEGFIEFIIHCKKQNNQGEMKCGAEWFHFDDLDLVFVSLKTKISMGKQKKMWE